MKKLLSMMLTLVLVLGMSTAAFAADDGSTTEGEATPTPTTTAYTDMTTVTLTKEYTLTNAGTTSPAETFSFSQLTCTSVKDAGVDAKGEVVTKKNAPVPTIGSATFEAGAAGDASKGKQNITITLPKYTAVGVYTYTFTEIDGGTAGVAYRTEQIKLVVTVIQQDDKVRVAAVHTEEKDQAKSGTFDNTYSAGSLAVKKVVTGNMGDQGKEFTVKVKFTAPEGKTVREAISYIDGAETKTIPAGDEGWTGSTEVDITLKHDETVTFMNIPYGVNYEVTENNYSDDGYSVSYDNEQKGTIEAESTSTTITNNKTGEVDTGIGLDSLPYILVLAVVCAGLVAFVSKKRMMREN